MINSCLALYVKLKEVRIQRVRLGRSSLKPTKVTFFTTILQNSENNIRHTRPFWRQIFCHSSVVKFTSTLLQSKPVMRLDCQILPKSSPLRSQAGSSPGLELIIIDTSDFSWFMKLHTLGTIVRQFAYWPIDSFLHPYESYLPIAPILPTRIIAAFQFLTSLGHHKGESDRKLLCWEIERQRRIFRPANLYAKTYMWNHEKD